MSEFKVEVVEINEILPIEGADRIERIKIKGYEVVSQKGKYLQGDLAVYIPEAGIVPMWILEAYDFKLAGAEKNRVKAIKLRGVVSQGILIPLMQYETYPVQWRLVDGEGVAHAVEVGDDVADIVGVTKYEPEIPTHMAGNVWNAFGYTHRYDVENIKNYPDVLQEGELVTITRKIHGCASEDTLVDTLEYGSIRIDKIVNDNLVGIHVKAFDIDLQEVVYELIDGVQRQPNIDNWYEIELEDSTILKLTGNHPVYVPELGAYRRVDELEGSEYLLTIS